MTATTAMTTPPTLYRVTDPTKGGALIMIAPWTTIAATFGLDDTHALARVDLETANGGTCDFHFNSRRPFLTFARVDITKAAV